MTEQYVLLALQQMQDSAEIYFHPTDGARLDELGPNPQDLKTLLSSNVRATIEARDLLPGTAAEKPQSSVSVCPPHALGARGRVPAA
jgi:hypothetical protein